MKRRFFESYPAGVLIGFFAGFAIVHPFSMAFQGIFLPMVRIDIGSIIYAFHPQHLPMAFFFGLLGMCIGIANVFYIRKISQEERHIKLLEGLLPICSYCKKIRDDAGTGTGEGKWERIEDYIYKKTEQEFTHGICPECVEKVFGKKE
jgi:hypothetical protein